MGKEGADLAFSYQGEAFGKRVAPLAASVGSDVLVDVDVTNDDSLDACFAALKDRWGTMDFLIHAIAYSDKNELTGRFINTTRENFSNSLAISCFSFIDVSRRASELMPNGGSLITLTYGGSNRVTPNYNVMGVAKAALESATRYLANDLGPQQVRVNAISPGPMKTLAGAAIGGARATFRHTEANAPMPANATPEAIGGPAVCLCSDYGAFAPGERGHLHCCCPVTGLPPASTRQIPAAFFFVKGCVRGQAANGRGFLREGIKTANPFGKKENVKMNPGSGNPDFVEPAGEPDPTVSFIALREPGGRLISIYSAYSLHYVGGVNGADITADYYGYY